MRGRGGLITGTPPKVLGRGKIALRSASRVLALNDSKHSMRSSWLGLIQVDQHLALGAGLFQGLKDYRHSAKGHNICDHLSR